MKALPGLLIEYLVTGTVFVLAILIVEALCMDENNLLTFVRSAKPAEIAISIPAVYCVGMVVDYFSKLLVEFIADRIKQLWDLISKNIPRFPKRKEKYSDLFSTAEIMLRSDLLGSEYVMRSSWDRVARGLFFSALLSTIILGYFKGIGCEFLIALGVSIFAFCVWWRFDHLTRRWKYKSTKALRNKGNN